MRAKSDLHPYQQHAVTRMYQEAYGQALMKMGLGKTVTALTAIRELIDDGHIRTAITVAPKRVVSVWVEEVKEWEHLLDHVVVPVIGTPTQRLAALDKDADTYVIGLDNLPWLATVLNSLPADHKFFDFLCFDEISRFRNPRSKRMAKFAHLLPRFNQRWGLTGTPVASGLLDQYMQVQVLSLGAVWPEKFNDWREKYFMATDYLKYNWVIRPEWLGKIMRDVDAISFTVADDEIPHTPELYVPNIHWVELPPKVMELYKTMEKDFLIWMEGHPVEAANAGVMTGKLDQLIQGFIYGDQGELVEVVHEEKVKVLIDLFEGCGGEPLLVAYHFHEDLKAIQRAFPDIPNLGSGVSDKEANKLVAAWNRNEIPIMAVHPASAGHGLNLQKGQARQLCWYSLTWSPELFDQLSARIARQGNDNDRIYVYPIMAKNTLDELKWDRVANKLTAQEAFIKYIQKI